jgi:hypothetical protein
MLPVIKSKPGKAHIQRKSSGNRPEAVRLRWRSCIIRAKQKGDLLGGRQEERRIAPLQNLAENSEALSPKEAKER